MGSTMLKRQFIRDAGGNRIGVILPMEEYARVLEYLDENAERNWETANLEQIEHAANDPVFLVDLRETMNVYQAVDAQWWEPEE
ncbi:MAG: hypothetical protein R2844_08115 [Caldilineales bacterium]